MASPRDTTTSRPEVNAASVSSTAAAQLFTTSDASAPQRAQQTTEFGHAPAASVRFRVDLQRSGAPAAAAIAAAVAALTGARPRLVWMIAPVALSAGRSRGVSSASAALVTCATTSSRDSGRPAVISARTAVASGPAQRVGQHLVSQPAASAARVARERFHRRNRPKRIHWVRFRCRPAAARPCHLGFLCARKNGSGKATPVCGRERGFEPPNLSASRTLRAG